MPMDRNGMPVLERTTHDGRGVPGQMLVDHEECGWYSMARQCIKELRSGIRIRTVVEGEIDRWCRRPRHPPYRVIGHIEKKRKRGHVCEHDHSDHRNEDEHCLSFLWLWCSFCPRSIRQVFAEQALLSAGYLPSRLWHGLIHALFKVANTWRIS